MGFGLKVMALVDGVDVKAIAELKPPPIFEVTVVVPVLPAAIVTEVGERLMAKPPAAVTVRLTEVVCVTPPPTPLTVIE